MTTIRHIRDVAMAVEGRKDFVVKETEDYTAIDYVYVEPSTFDDPVRRECRGLKFHPDGRIMARPFHKFFNVNERPETQADAIDWTRPHVVLDKLDGSMIHPAAFGTNVVFMTRMGVTDVAEACELRHLTPLAEALCFNALEDGWTPIFEWTSPVNRVVLPYDKCELSLLALRRTVSGEYLSYDETRRWAELGGWPMPRLLASDAYGDWQGLARHCEGLENAEGFVVWFEGGEAVKVKAPWYVTRHRALDGLRHEHHVVRLILDNGLDDVLPLLTATDRQRLDRFATDLRAAIACQADALRGIIAKHLDMDRKMFAISVVAHLRPLLRPVAWRVYDGRDDYVNAVIWMIRRGKGSGSRIRAVLDQIGGPKWN